MYNIIFCNYGKIFLKGHTHIPFKFEKKIVLKNNVYIFLIIIIDVAEKEKTCHNANFKIVRTTIIKFRKSIFELNFLNSFI